MLTMTGAPVTLQATSALTEWAGGGAVDGFLTVGDLAARLGRTPQTVRRFRSDSKPGHRYADTPFPEPDRMVGHMPVWSEARLPEIEAWMAARPGMGTGGGSPSHRKNRISAG